MDHKHLMDLFLRGMRYPLGRHRFLFSRCFEVTIHPDRVVEMDEYENFSSERLAGRSHRSKMFHVGRSVLHLKEGRVVEEKGLGWGHATPKGKVRRKGLTKMVPDVTHRA